jgi:hypothetical protein
MSGRDQWADVERQYRYARRYEKRLDPEPTIVGPGVLFLAVVVAGLLLAGIIK